MGFPQSISFVSFQTNASLGLPPGASKSGRTGWIGFFNGSVDAVDGAGGVGFEAIVCALRFTNSGRLRRILRMLILQL
jgi:hypothetical protein